MNKIILSIVFVFSVLGCATGYQKEGLTGGFSETRLDENIFQVSFKGNEATSEERVLDFTLLRSAELALENGYKYFLIVDSEQNTEHSTYTTPVTSNTTASAYGMGNYAYGTATTTTTGGQTYNFSKPRRKNTIICFEERPNIEGLVYNATFIERSIKEKYDIE